MSQTGSALYVADPLELHPEDLPDIQGIIVRGFNIPSVRHFVLTIGNVKAAKLFLDAISSGSGPLTITSAAPWPGGEKPPYTLTIGLTAQGLQALELPASVTFNTGNFKEFLCGAVAAAPFVGDTGTPSDPNNWVDKLNSQNADLAHILLTLFTHTAETRDEYSAILRGMFADVIPPEGTAGCEVLEWDVDDILYIDPTTGEEYHKIHFGYTDGISNPIIASADLPPLRPGQLPYVPAWQFVTRDGEMTSYNLPQPPELGQNGSFSAFRILEQNVPAFDAFLQAEGRSEDEQEFLVSKMCGRWRNGNPVVKQPDAPGPILPDNELTDFDYGTDTVGEPCPYSAHTRRANARGGPGVIGMSNPPTDANKQLHRIMRRATPYGPPYSGVDDGKPRGLAGHFIGAVLHDQFEFIMGQWVNSGTFPGGRAQAGLDPLLGDTAKSGDFTYWSNNEAVTVPNLLRFTTVRGGMYCFLPSLTAIKWMAQNGGAPNPWTIPPLTR
jgi:deferrochelatase/peroxidase EfeB